MKPPCYPSTRTGPGVRQSGARSMPRTTEARRHLPASLASLWTTSEETTVLWVSSISDGAGHRQRVRKLGCDDHTWDPAQSWTADGQSPSTTGGVGGAGKTARERCGHRQQEPLGSQCDGQGGLESAGQGAPRNPHPVSGPTQRSCSYTPSRSVISSYSSLVSHSPETTEHVTLKCLGCLCLVFLKCTALPLCRKKNSHGENLSISITCV